MGHSHQQVLAEEQQAAHSGAFFYWKDHFQRLSCVTGHESSQPNMLQGTPPSCRRSLGREACGQHAAGEGNCC